MEAYKRTAVMDSLKDYEAGANNLDYIEVTEWGNRCGVDVEISSKSGCKFSLTYGEFEALKN